MRLSETDQRRASSFGAVADEYERLRPGYPAELFDDIVSRAGELTAQGTLEIGAGGGRATLELARRGLDIVAVEPSADMVRVLQERLATEQPRGVVTVRQERFDDLEAPDGPFGVVVAAQSFHWTDPGTRWTRLADLLVPGGLAFLFWNGWALDPAMHDLEAVRELYGTVEGLVPDIEDVRSSGNWAETEIRDEPRLEEPEAVVLAWAKRLSIEDYLGLLGTTSQYIVAEPAHREAVFEGLRPVLGDHVDLTGRTMLLVTRRLA